MRLGNNTVNTAVLLKGKTVEEKKPLRKFDLYLGFILKVTLKAWQHLKLLKYKILKEETAE